MSAAFARADLIETSDGCGVVEVFLKDGRQFTILAATPAWFKAECARLGLPFYYGAPVLFLKKIDATLARKAAKAMHAEDEQLLMRHDTPRRTLPDILAEFKSSLAA